MVTVLIITLFIIQLITIFIIILLNSKVSKFKDLETRQNQLIDEMDNTISVYLLEMKDENDRLITELQQAKKPMNKIQTQPATQGEVKKDVLEPVATTYEKPIAVVEEEKPDLEPRTFVPIKMAANAYSKQKAHAVVNDTEAEQEALLEKTNSTMKIPPPKEPTFEEQVIAQHRAGNSIEEIAKQMQRGKTEIELLIKFHA